MSEFEIVGMGNVKKDHIQIKFSNEKWCYIFRGKKDPNKFILKMKKQDLESMLLEPFKFGDAKTDYTAPKREDDDINVEEIPF